MTQKGGYLPFTDRLGKDWSPSQSGHFIGSESASLYFGRIELPFALHALERSGTVIAKAQAGAGHQILDGAGHQHLARRGERGYAGADMDRDPTHIVTHYLALSSVKTSADLESQRLHPPRYRAGAADSPSGTVEGSEKPIAGCLDLATTKSNEFAANQHVVAIEKIPPPAVAE